MKLGFRADWLPFPHLVKFSFWNIADLLFYFRFWTVASRQAGGAIEDDSKVSTLFVGIIFGTRVKEAMPSPFIQNLLPELGETIPTVIFSFYFCSNVAGQGRCAVSHVYALNCPRYLTSASRQVLFKFIETA